MSTKKHAITSDARLNPRLKAEVQTLRGGIVAAANQRPLSKRFVVEAVASAPSMKITDLTTRKSAEVPLFAYGEVRDVLTTLFPD